MSSRGYGGCFHKAFILLVGVDQRFDRAAQRLILGTSLLEEGRPFFGSPLNRSLEQLLDSLPSLRVQCDLHPLLISCRSHALATFQSRFTVREDTPTTAAVSSTLSPLKYLSSTTRLCCGSIAANRVRASSSATTSTFLSGEITISSS